MKGLTLVAAALLLAAPLTVHAQDADECDVDLGSPQPVARAWLALSKATSTMSEGGDPSSDLREMMRTLTDPRARDRDRNPAGRDYLSAQAYLLFLAHDTPPIVRAGDLGVQGNPDEMIDLVVAADTLLRSVEAAHPACAATIAQFRQYKPWVDLLNGSINLLNTNQLDSAEFLARRSLVLYDGAPYAYSVLGAVAQNKGQDSEALTHFRKALEIARGDTLYEEVRVSTLGDIARLLGEQASMAPAAQQAGLARDAIAAYEVYLSEEGIPDAVRAGTVAQLSGMYQLAGDTAGVRRIYAPILQNPAAYGENTLLQAGAIAMSVSDYPDAARLFGTAYERNAHHRDAVNNLAASYIGTEEFTKAFPLMKKLAELEPNNPDAMTLYVYAYSGMLQGTQNAAARRAYTDSLVKYSQLAEQMPVAVSVTEFSRLREETRLSGTIANRGQGARTFSLTVELLGPDGSVLGTEAVSVGPVGAGSQERFRVTIPVAGENVAGYRYRPVS